MMRRTVWLWLGLLWLGPIVRADDPAPKNVVYVTLDGFRWQEVFRGAEESLISEKDGGVKDIPAIRKAFWRDTPEERREALMPFLWTVVARQGQIFGNRDRGSTARVTNGLKFSYPGYNEMFAGKADPRIDSNGKILNPNITVMEWLNGRAGFEGKVSAVASWDLYPFIFNQERSKLAINSGWEPYAGSKLSESQTLLNRLIKQAPHIWDDCRDDAFTFQIARDSHQQHAPRVFYVGLGDTDEHAHSGRYDKYLRAARDTDDNLRAFWENLQSRPEFRGSTTLFLSTDHGRGDAPQGWKSHGEKVDGAEYIWIAAMGPLTPALGERSNVADVTQSQVAATLAAFVGEDFHQAKPEAAPPIADLISKP